MKDEVGKGLTDAAMFRVGASPSTRSFAGRRPDGSGPRSGFERFATLRPAQGLAVLLLAIAIAVAPIDPTFSLRTGALLAGASLLLSMTSIRTTWVDVFAAGYAGVVLASSLWTEDPAATELSGLNTVACVVLFIAVRTLARSRAVWLSLTAVLAAGGLYVVYRIFTDNQLREASLTLDSTGTRYSVGTINANYLSYSLVTASALLILVALTTNRRRALPLLAICLVFYVGAVQAGTRGALAGIALAAVWVGLNRLVRFTSSRPLGRLFAALLAVSVFIAVGGLQAVLAGRLTSSVRDTGDLNGRLVVWPLARDQWWESFWFGRGAGTFPSNNSLHIAAHNFMLDIGFGVGIIGVSLFLVVLYRALWTETENVVRRVPMIGTYVLASAPLLLSGYWIESPVFWVGLALASRAGVLPLRTAAVPEHRPRPRRRPLVST